MLHNAAMLSVLPVLCCSWTIGSQNLSSEPGLTVLLSLSLVCQHSGIEKAFLFDMVSKIYIATDSSAVDMQSYELCCDMIDVVIDISCIYG